VCGLDLSASGKEQAAGSREHANGPSGSIRDGEFLDWLSDYYLPKKDSAPWSYSITAQETD